ncbi:MAG: hypothetical protein Q9M45_12785 [Robiginitomaculum sp.]|nr:hypothetical protein [Robiginitomaculum sp.]
MNFEGVKHVGELFGAELISLGFTTQWVEGANFGRAGHLVASYGTKGPKILLIGHLDTVFAKTDDFQRFEPLGDDKTKGPGITDMKGGDGGVITHHRHARAGGCRGSG